MKNNIAKIACFALVAASLVAVPAISRAADSTNAPAGETPKKRANNSLPYHGKVVAVDAAAMTFTIGETTLAITSTTKISKEGKPAVFSDITVGENVTGSYKKDADGKNNATSVKIGGAKKSTTEPAAKTQDTPMGK
jgi:hypothetical protein